MKRTFVGIRIELEAALHGFVERLKQSLNKESIRWVSEENLHLTLHFFGNIDEQQEADLMSIFREIADSERAFEFSLGGVHFFKRGQHPRVLFIDVCHTEALLYFAISLKNKLLENRLIEKEELDFRPHLTIARMKVLKEKDCFYEVLNKQALDCPTQKVRVSEITFFESLTKPEGPVYTSLSDFKLRD